MADRHQLPMSKSKVKPIPKGYGTVTPAFTASDAKAVIDFLKRAFGAKTRAVMNTPDGKIMHSEITIGDSLIMISDRLTEEPVRPTDLFLYVEKVDKVFDKAVKAGAKVLMPVADQFWGDRFGQLEDPFGNRYSIATHVEDVTPKQLKKRMAGPTPPTEASTSE
jgi:PhnB protein